MELNVVSVCAACIQANEIKNIQRIAEIQDSILKCTELPALGSAEFSYCRGQIPLVQDCPLAAGRSTGKA